MTVKEQLLKDKILNKNEAAAIAKKACSSEAHFNELMMCFLSGEYRLAQRAAWCVSHAVALQISFIFPYIKQLVNQLLRKDVHNAVIRNSLRILKQIHIPRQHHGEVMNACFAFIEKSETPIAVKAFALSILHKLSLIYPDIQQELEMIAALHINNESAAIKSVAKKITGTLHKRKAPGINNQSAKINKHDCKHDVASGKQANSTD